MPKAGDAKLLVSAANIIATSSFDNFVESLPSLQAARPLAVLLKDWDFVVTVAGVGVAFMSIADTVPESEQESVCQTVARELVAWHADGYEALLNLTQFVHRRDPHGDLAPLIIGWWVFAHLADGAQPSDDEHRALAGLGVFLLRAFVDWWTKDTPGEG